MNADEADADAALAAAIDRVARCGDQPLPDSCHITDYVVVYVAQDPDRDDHSIYGSAYPAGIVPGYRPLGLLAIAQRQLLHGGWDEDIEP